MAYTQPVDQDPMLQHLRAGGTVHYAAAKDAQTRCKRGRVATNYWPAVTCRGCQAKRTRDEGNLRTSS